MGAIAPKWTVKEQFPRRAQASSRPFDQTSCGAEGCNVDHVGGEDPVQFDVFQRTPMFRAHIKVDGRAHIIKA